MSGNRWPSWLRSYLLRYRRDAAVALGLGLVASACAALLMFTSGYLISATALATTTLFSVMVPIACVQLFGFGRPLARYAERLASHNWVLRVTSDLRVRLFHAADERTGDPARARATGEYLGLLSDDVAHLQNLYLRVVFPTAIAYALAVAASLLFGFFSAGFAIAVLLSLAGVCVLLPACTLLVTRALVCDAKDARSVEQVQLADDLLGATDWALAGRSGEVVGRHARTSRAIRESEFRVRLRQRGFSTTSTLALGALLCAAVAWAGEAFGPDAGTRVACWIAAFALGFFPLIESFAVLPAAVSESTTHRASVRRLDEFMEQDNGAQVQPADRPKPHDLAHAVELDGVTYRYPNADAPALSRLSLALEHGTAVAVLGRSGAGKSTLGNVIAGNLDPQTGSVSTAGRVCLLGQIPYLFNRTLRANLTLGMADASDGELAEALGRVGLGDKLSSLPRGLDTVIGETGVGLSGGEAHRVAFARALLTDAPIVVVDEPFAALDPETERALLDTMLHAFADRCLVVITHHLAEIERFDRVVFVEEGTVALDGSPAALAASSERYRTLLMLDLHG